MNDPRQQPWLPELCRLPRLAAMLGLAERVVVVVALAPDGSRHWSVSDFLTASGRLGLDIRHVFPLHVVPYHA
mgnify:CR=1 FL=1